MTTTDTEFLAQVEDLLASCDLPLLPSLENDSDEQNLPTCQDPKNDATLETHLWEWQMKDSIARHELVKAKDRKRRRAYRERRRSERESLRQEIEKLTEELLKVKASKKSLALPDWEMVAQHQLATRRRSEDHQKQLHKAIGVRDAMIKEFGHLVHEANQQFQYHSGWNTLNGFHNQTNPT